jgi:soluble cytochrome b562
MTAASTTTLPPSEETLRSLMDDQAEHIGQQRERIKVLEAALREIAKQVPAKDMDEDYYEAADFEHGYDSLIFIARDALTSAERIGKMTRPRNPTE